MGHAWDSGAAPMEAVGRGKNPAKASVMELVERRREGRPRMGQWRRHGEGREGGRSGCYCC